MRHQLVNADCARFTPTNAVNKSHHLLTHTASARLIKIKVPAIRRIIDSNFIAPPIGDYFSRHLERSERSPNRAEDFSA